MAQLIIARAPHLQRPHRWCGSSIGRVISHLLCLLSRAPFISNAIAWQLIYKWRVLILTQHFAWNNIRRPDQRRDKNNVCVIFAQRISIAFLKNVIEPSVIPNFIAAIAHTD